MERGDDYKDRRKHLERLSDDELKKYFWELVDKIIMPLVDEAKTHTSPSIERSILLRMGFSSIEAKGIVNILLDRSLLGHGAGNIVYKTAEKNGIDIRSAGLGILDGKYKGEMDQ
jgi:D-ornithine 4,5-aminomutase subunit alpha